MNIAFIGLGNMGGAMAKNLLKSGYQVYGFDLNTLALEHFAAAGGIVCASPQDAAQHADVVLTMLPAAKHVRDVYLGANGILNVLKAATICIDSSTIDPNTIQEIAAAAEACQVHVCDAPVSGGTLGAQDATLTFMVGADSDTFAAIQPVLSAMGKNLVHCGPIGTGQVAKICNNLILGISMTAVAESMALGVQLGMDPQALAGVINSSTGRCWSSEVYNPWPGICENAPASRGYRDGFAAQLMLKDLGLAVEAAAQAQYPMVLGNVVQKMYQQLCREGDAHLDFSSIMYQYCPEYAQD
ncbi:MULTISPECIES: 3-hydroxyisobutyrate dehydrogenase [unclassified Acinetobacter]|uniref:3-hydroxyisobutyrate dehydrogenase n=1 Tax=unclassified Acinetobacter TaxID=196816 RepID=UPI0029343A6F|nr:MULTISPECIES: 3-hydroxyisobutyrate dehydrogenase [unclassified Acinetobacter]WOE32413.1 3-hydroxyisobutyrate dehydrogenase [Acinetobacter sp. SAAs470]WOE37887.1 3-hydroxyisobutyrate dehydrogenase [Acinetobacter sp. SAAs474]